MSKKVVIISLNFRVAHISHLVASYRQMEELGCRPICFIHPKAVKFLPGDVMYTTNSKQMCDIDIAIFWFPSIQNIKLMWKLKRVGAKIIYVFHEPIEKFSDYIASGNSFWGTIKVFVKYYIGLSFLLQADKILLPSHKAIMLYERGIAKRMNRNYEYMPLIYSDESYMIKSNIRQFFSYIGSISRDHAFENYVDFIYYMFEKNILPNIKFLIASWNQVLQDDRIEKMVVSGRLKVVSGEPMTNEEINGFYASSFLVWNAYHRSTQSGVLAKSFMFGTPGLVMKHNLSEFVKDGREVIAVNSNSDFDELICAVKNVIENFVSYSKNSRINFEKNYLYMAHNNKMQQIITSL